MIYLFDKHLELIEVLKKPHSATMTRRLIGVDRIFVEDGINAISVLEESSFAGAFFRNKFYIFKKNKHGSNNNRVYFDGINYAHDELANIKVISDRRLQDASASVAMSAAIEGTGWTLGTVQTTSIQSTNFYYITPLQAIQKIIETWQIEPDFYFEFDGKQITGRKIDIYQKRGRVTGERYVYGSDILEIAHEEERTNIVTALYGRGKGEEIYDADGNPTGGYGRRINFADVVWSKTNGDPVDKPAGQEYVEIPGATQEYGYPTADGALNPRFDVYIDEGIEDSVELLRATYNVAVERSRPLVTFTSTVAKAGPYDLGDTNYIFRPDLDIAYEARIFEDEIDLLNPKRTKFKFGDYIPSGQVKRLKEIQARFDGLNDKIQGVEESTKGQLIKVSKDWYDALMEVKEGTFFSGSSYNYSLENGNPYGLPAGFYSFDAPLEGNPTGFLVIQGGKIGRGKILSGGEWDFNLIGDEDGLTADAIVAGKIKAQFIEIGASSTFLEGYDPSTKADSDEVYTITELDTKFTALDGEISSKVSSTTYTNEKPTYGATAPTVKPVGRLWVDTSKDPNLLKRWNGSSWEIVNDTSALVTRVEEAESKVTSKAIVDTVSEATNQDNEPLFAKTSEVKLTVDEWTAKFSQIGGRNLLRSSKVNLSNNSYPTGSFYMVEPMEEDETYTITVWGSLGANKENFALYLNGGSIRLTYLEKIKTGMYQATFEGVSGGVEDFVNVYPMPQSITSVSKITHVQLEKGSVGTDWSPAPEEFYEGIVKIDRDGISVHRSNSDIDTNVSHEGLAITDGEDIVASFMGGGAVIQNLSVKNIHSSMVSTRINSNTTITVRSVPDDGEYGTITDAITSLGRSTELQFGATVNIDIYGTILDDVVISQFIGTGTLALNFQSGAKLIGSIDIVGCSCAILIRGFGNKGIIQRNISKPNPIRVRYGTGIVYVSDMVLDASGETASAFAIGSIFGSKVLVFNCDINYATFALYAQAFGQISSVDNIGNNITLNSAYTEIGGVIWLQGTVPNCNGTIIGGSQGHHVQKDVVKKTSTYVTTDIVTGIKTQVFTPSEIYTVRKSDGYISAYYGESAVQGYYTGNKFPVEGVVKFGSEVYNFFKNDTETSVKIRFKRKASTNGMSAPVAPRVYNVSLGTFMPVSRGEWTPWLIISKNHFTSNGATFKLYPSVVKNETYAWFDGCEVQVQTNKKTTAPNPYFEGIETIKHRYNHETDYYITEIPFGLKPKIGLADDLAVGESTISFAQRTVSTVAINAGIFETAPFGFKGVLIKDGSIINGTQYISGNNAHVLTIDNDGILDSVDSNTTTAQDILDSGINNALQGWFPLIKNGISLDNGSMVYNPLQIIGQKENGDYVIFTCDGRTAQDRGMRFADAISVLLDIGVEFAYNLDGGGSSSTVNKLIKQNKNIDASDRKVLNFLYWAK